MGTCLVGGTYLAVDGELVFWGDGELEGGLGVGRHGGLDELV
jgi:hypothetical protein